MARFTLLGFKILKSQTENEMTDFFYRYENILSLQKTKKLDEITEWGDTTIRNIQKYVNKQKSVLEQDYTNRINHLNKTSKKFVEELHVIEQTHNNEQINQLLRRCNALRFQLAAIEYHSQNIPFIHLTKNNGLTDSMLDKSDANESENDKFHNISIMTDANETRKYMITDVRFTDTKRTKRPSLTVETLSDEDRSAMLSHDMVEECPTCFMVFPSTMTSHDRTVHINGHFPN